MPYRNFLNTLLYPATLAFVLLFAGCGAPVRSGGSTYSPGLDLRSEDSSALSKVSVIEVLPVKYEKEASLLFGTEEKPQDMIRDIVRRHSSLRLQDPATGQKADSRLLVHVLKASERKGGVIGADEGAMIRMRMELTDLQGIPIWAGDYYYKDQAVSDNLLDLKKRSREKPHAGWVSLRDLFSRGVKEGIINVNQRRNRVLPLRSSF